LLEKNDCIDDISLLESSLKLKTKTYC